MLVQLEPIRTAATRAACSAAFGWRPHTVRWPRLPF